MEFKDVIQNRYSCKDFSTQQIEKEKLNILTRNIFNITNEEDVLRIIN